MYLSSNTCRKHLAGDACAILRIHSFLEHWGLINFKLISNFKPNFIPKAFNFKSPIYIDSNLLMFDNFKNNKINNISNYNNPESSIVLTNQKKAITTLYPINKISNKIFNNFLDDFNNNDNNENDNSDLKRFQKINFLSQNYRPKCDVCGNLCTMDWHISKDKKDEEENESDNDLNVSINIDEKSVNKEFFLICDECFSNNDIPLPNNLKRENFELSSIYNLFSKEKLNGRIIDKINKDKWTEEENKKLIEGIKKDSNWEDVVNSLGNNTKKTKKDCILHLLQMPMNNSDQKYNEDSDELMEEEENDEVEEEGKIQNIEEIKDEEKLNENEKEKIYGNNNENNFNINNENNIIEEKNDKIDGNVDDEVDREKKKEINNKKGLNNSMNNNMIEMFMRLFRRYLNENNNNNIGDKSNNKDNEGNILNKSFKDIIYKTFAKSINKCKELKNDEKNEMKNIVDILVYLEMKKIELKMNYFKQFERLLEYKKTQLKTIETQIIQERIKLITKKLLLQQKQQQANENK